MRRHLPHLSTLPIYSNIELICEAGYADIKTSTNTKAEPTVLIVTVRL
jgi:hypothetical protein